MFTFTKNHTTIVKGLAIFCMIIYHMFGVDGNLPPENTAAWMCTPFLKAFQICVPLFLFMSGFGLQRSDMIERVTVRKQIKRLSYLYRDYWWYGIPFIVINIIHAPYKVSIKDVILELTGLITPHCGTWWFFSLYVELCIIFLFVVKINLNKYKKLCLIISTFILFRYVLGYIPDSKNIVIHEFRMILIDLHIFWMGMFFSEFYLFEKIVDSVNTYMNKNTIKVIFGLVCILLSLFVRAYVPYIGVTELFFVPVFIFGGLLLCNTIIIKDVLLIFGKYSTPLWLVHNFFVYYYPNGITTITANPFLMFSLVIIQSAIVIFIIRKVRNILEKLFGCLKCNPC